ncbi:MAG: family molecular chaperone-like protein [Acidobacteriales bacterium]|nr:family molecular chaperone-like protein [Terriglobales bacterium]
MSGNLPVLASIKSSWTEITERPVVGKDVLELLSSAMYVNPLSIFREYIQNSTDSIEEAVAAGLLATEEGRVDITVDAQMRRCLIRDNGMGLSKSEFAETLVALGASRKRGMKARGFRGVGRLAGLGYCQELIFRSRAEGESQINELRWDCRKLKELLRDKGTRSDVEQLIKNVVRIRRFVSSDWPDRFFEVELTDIVRHGDDSLVNVREIESYLSQVAPVPFSPDFLFKKQIEDFLRAKLVLGNVHIFVNARNTPLYRPHRNEFEARKRVLDRFIDVELFDIEGRDGGLAASGWILHHNYRGAIDRKALIKGLRLRSGNIQVGESDVLDEVFVEARFNAWSVGEIHVLDSRIVPNGRRDHFEQSAHFRDCISRLVPKIGDLSKRCRVSSIRRNVLRQFEGTTGQIDHLISVLKQGAVTATDSKKIERDLRKELARLDGLSGHSALTLLEKEIFSRKILVMSKKVETVISETYAHKTLRKAKAKDRTIIVQICSLIYECSQNKKAAKLLVDQVLRRL